MAQESKDCNIMGLTETEIIRIAKALLKNNGLILGVKIIRRAFGYDACEAVGLVNSLILEIDQEAKEQ